METIEHMLRAHPVTAGLDDAALATIAGCARNVVADPGEYLLREGDAAERFFLLRFGRVALESHVPPRGPLTFLTLGPGELVGASWLVPPYRWTHDVRVVEQVRAIVFDALCLRGKCEADPALGYAVMKAFVPLLIERLRQARLQSADLFHERRYSDAG